MIQGMEKIVQRVDCQILYSPLSYNTLLCWNATSTQFYPTTFLHNVSEHFFGYIPSYFPGALFDHLKAEGVELLQICFRWMNCLLIRELPLSAVIRLWDTYIAEGPVGFSEFHIYVCSGEGAQRCK